MSGERATVEAVAQQVERIEEELDEEQIDLFAEPETESGKQKIVQFRRGPGRPAGSRNKRTERTLAWLRAKYRDPREALLAIVTMHTADLAALWGCSMLDAAQEQRLCAATVLPFVAQKQAIAISLDTRQAVHLHVDLSGIAGVAGDGAAIAKMPRVLDMGEYQELLVDPAEAGEGGDAEPEEEPK